MEIKKYALLFLVFVTTFNIISSQVSITASADLSGLTNAANSALAAATSTANSLAASANALANSSLNVNVNGLGGSVNVNTAGLTNLANSLASSATINANNLLNAASNVSTGINVSGGASLSAGGSVNTASKGNSMLSASLKASIVAKPEFDIGGVNTGLPDDYPTHECAKLYACIIAFAPSEMKAFLIASFSTDTSSEYCFDVEKIKTGLQKQNSALVQKACNKKGSGQLKQGNAAGCLYLMIKSETKTSGFTSDQSNRQNSFVEEVSKLYGSQLGPINQNETKVYKTLYGMIFRRFKIFTAKKADAITFCGKDSESGCLGTCKYETQDAKDIAAAARAKISNKMNEQGKKYEFLNILARRTGVMINQNKGCGFRRAVKMGASGMGGLNVNVSGQVLTGEAAVAALKGFTGCTCSATVAEEQLKKTKAATGGLSGSVNINSDALKMAASSLSNSLSAATSGLGANLSLNADALKTAASSLSNSLSAATSGLGANLSLNADALKTAASSLSNSLSASTSGLGANLSTSLSSATNAAAALAGSLSGGVNLNVKVGGVRNLLSISGSLPSVNLNVNTSGLSSALTSASNLASSIGGNLSLNTGNLGGSLSLNTGNLAGLSADLTKAASSLGGSLSLNTGNLGAAVSGLGADLTKAASSLGGSLSVNAGNLGTAVSGIGADLSKAAAGLSNTAANLGANLGSLGTSLGVDLNKAISAGTSAVSNALSSAGVNVSAHFDKNELAVLGCKCSRRNMRMLENDVRNLSFSVSLDTSGLNNSLNAALSSATINAAGLSTSLNANINDAVKAAAGLSSSLNANLVNTSASLNTNFADVAKAAQSALSGASLSLGTNIGDAAKAAQSALNSLQGGINVNIGGGGSGGSVSLSAGGSGSGSGSGSAAVYSSFKYKPAVLSSTYNFATTALYRNCLITFLTTGVSSDKCATPAGSGQDQGDTSDSAAVDLEPLLRGSITLTSENGDCAGKLRSSCTDSGLLKEINDEVLFQGASECKEGGEDVACAQKVGPSSVKQSVNLDIDGFSSSLNATPTSRLRSLTSGSFVVDDTAAKNIQPLPATATEVSDSSLTINGSTPTVAAAADVNSAAVQSAQTQQAKQEASNGSFIRLGALMAFFLALAL